jgi:hypothetical protein
MLEAASFSLCALLVFRPRVRGGDGTELSSGSEVSTEPLEGTETTRPTEAEGSGTEVRVSFAAIVSEGVESVRLSFAGGSSLTVVASGSRASSSFSASKLFIFSRVASAVWVAFGAWASRSFRLGCRHRLVTS